MHFWPARAADWNVGSIGEDKVRPCSSHRQTAGLSLRSYRRGSRLWVPVIRHDCPACPVDCCWWFRPFIFGARFGIVLYELFPRLLLVHAVSNYFAKEAWLQSLLSEGSIQFSCPHLIEFAERQSIGPASTSESTTFNGTHTKAIVFFLLWSIPSPPVRVVSLSTRVTAFFSIRLLWQNSALAHFCVFWLQHASAYQDFSQAHCSLMCSLCGFAVIASPPRYIRETNYLAIVHGIE